MRGEIGGEDQGSESGDGESVKGVNESFTPSHISFGVNTKIFKHRYNNYRSEIFSEI